MGSIFGGLMFGSMIAGGIAGAFSANSAGNINNACESWDKASDKFNDALKTWKSIAEDGFSNEEASKELGQALALNSVEYKTALTTLKDKYREQETSYIIAMCIFVFVVLTCFLFKYFNVINLVWNYITDKKNK